MCIYVSQMFNWNQRREKTMCQLQVERIGLQFTIHKLESNEQSPNLRDWNPSHT